MALDVVYESLQQNMKNYIFNSWNQRTLTIGGSITADLLFDWLGFDQKSQTVFDPNKIKSRWAVQLYFPLSYFPWWNVSEVSKR